jgi:hypothetical protein
MTIHHSDSRERQGEFSRIEQGEGLAMAISSQPIISASGSQDRGLP